jgi:hypothetical protein
MDTRKLCLLCAALALVVGCERPAPQWRHPPTVGSEIGNMPGPHGERAPVFVPKPRTIEA